MLALTTASLRGTTRGIAGQWRVYILKCGSDPPNAGHLRAMIYMYVFGIPNVIPIINVCTNYSPMIKCKLTFNVYFELT